VLRPGLAQRAWQQEQKAQLRELLGQALVLQAPRAQSPGEPELPAQRALQPPVDDPPQEARDEQRERAQELLAGARLPLRRLLSRRVQLPLRIRRLLLPADAALPFRRHLPE
jgi:hypothetical protein